jgi:hypothetical protein
MNVRRALVTAVLVLAASALSRPAECARQVPAAVPGQAARQVARPAQLVAPAELAAPRAAAEDADAVRDQLEKLLSRYSPNVGRVFALDPLLLQNAAYLETYPDLVVFLNQHPEVLRNSSYYLAPFRSDFYRTPDRETRTIQMWGAFFAGLAVFSGFLILTGALMWVIKTLVDYRRWYRLSKVQTEAHNKLLDRFTANEELLAYINTPSGKRFLESAPIMLDGTGSMGSPLKRILWAVQVGVVLACAAGGILIGRYAVPPDFGPPFTVAGYLFVALGIGFILAAVASFVISQRMGVLGPASKGAGQTDAPAA